MTTFSPTRQGAIKRCDEPPANVARQRGLVFLVILLGSLLPFLFLRQSYVATQRGNAARFAQGHWLSQDQLHIFRSSLEDASTASREVVVVLAEKNDYLVEERDLLGNFFFLARQAGLAENVLLVALDAQTAAAASELHHGHVFPFFNTTASRTEIKYQLLLEAVTLGHTVLFSSLEMAWLREPWGAFTEDQAIQLIEQRPPPVVAQLDIPGSSSTAKRRLHHTEGGTEAHQRRRALQERGLKQASGAAAGTSVAFLRPSESASAFLRTMTETMASYPGVEERDLLNAVLKLADADVAAVPGAGLFTWKVLDRERFWDGLAELHSDPGESLAGAFDDAPLAVSRKDVRYRLREAGLWGSDRALVDCVRKEGAKLTRRGLKGESKGGACSKGKKFMYYFEMLEHNGLNNQRQELRVALALAEFLGRTLILPKFYRQHKEAAPVLLDYFFDYDAFDGEFPDVLPGRMLEELFPEWEKLPIQYIDIGTDPSPPKDAPWLDRVKTFQASRYHLGATEEEITSWFGKNTDPLLVFYSAFRRFGQLKDAGKQLELDRRVYRGMAPHPLTAALRNQTVSALRQISSNNMYNCFHLRRGDTFLQLHPEYEKSLEEIADLLKKFLPPEELLYISTDASIDETRSVFTGAGYRNVHFLGDLFPSWGWKHVTTEDGKETMRLGQIDQAVCALGKQFVGNLWSTFTTHIGFIRRMNGEEQVCQDIYKREVGPDFLFY